MESVPHILVAEDERLEALALAATLEGQGLRVTLTHNGLEAITALENGPASLLMTDLRMPVMDGNELIRRTRARRPALPVIVMTADSGALWHPESDRLRVLHKPFSFQAAIGAVRAMLDRVGTTG